MMLFTLSGSLIRNKGITPSKATKTINVHPKPNENWELFNKIFTTPNLFALKALLFKSTDPMVSSNNRNPTQMCDIRSVFHQKPHKSTI